MKSFDVTDTGELFIGCADGKLISYDLCNDVVTNKYVNFCGNGKPLDQIVFNRYFNKIACFSGNKIHVFARVPLVAKEDKPGKKYLFALYLDRASYQCKKPFLEDDVSYNLEYDTDLIESMKKLKIIGEPGIIKKALLKGAALWKGFWGSSDDDFDSSTGVQPAVQAGAGYGAGAT